MLLLGGSIICKQFTLTLIVEQLSKKTAIIICNDRLLPVHHGRRRTDEVSSAHAVATVEFAAWPFAERTFLVVSRNSTAVIVRRRREMEIYGSWRAPTRTVSRHYYCFVNLSQVRQQNITQMRVLTYHFCWFLETKVIEYHNNEIF